MRAPCHKGTPIDGPRVAEWLERFDGYRVAATEARIRSWLGNFEPDDAGLAARVLDVVEFLRSEDMEAAVRTTVKGLAGWHRQENRRKGRWRFVAFSISPGESGDTMLHKLRTALGLTGRQYNKLFIYKADLIREELSAGDTVVFVDDFAGTGQQACDAWHEQLAELLPGNPRTYLVVVAAGRRAVDRIGEETGLQVVTSLVLEPGDDIFSAACQQFTRREKADLLAYCLKADPRKPRGFGECGFVIVMAHGTPNNSIPILHANHEDWRGLFPRH